MMVPSYLEDMLLAEAVHRFTLELNEHANTLDYLMGEAEFVIKFVHDSDPDDQWIEHVGSLKVKLRAFDRKAKKIVVFVSNNDMPGLNLASRELVLHFGECDDEDLLFVPVERIDGMTFEPNFRTTASEWVNLDKGEDNSWIADDDNIPGSANATPEAVDDMYDQVSRFTP